MSPEHQGEDEPYDPHIWDRLLEEARIGREKQEYERRGANKPMVEWSLPAPATTATSSATGGSTTEPGT
jgi:hypothetical protein